MEDARVSGAKNGVQNMLFYYLMSLIDAGVKDPKQYIATEIAKMISLSEEQLMYVKTNSAFDNKLLDTLSSSIGLLSNMEKANKIDVESIHIVIGLLEAMQKECSKVIQEGDKDA